MRHPQPPRVISPDNPGPSKLRHFACQEYPASQGQSQKETPKILQTLVPGACYFTGHQAEKGSRSVLLIKPTPSITKGNLLPLKTLQAPSSDSSWGLLGIWRFSLLCFFSFKDTQRDLFFSCWTSCRQECCGSAAPWGPSLTSPPKGGAGRAGLGPGSQNSTNSCAAFENISL